MRRAFGAHPHSQAIVHVVFSTKNREPLIVPEIRLRTTPISSCSSDFTLQNSAHRKILTTLCSAPTARFSAPESAHQPRGESPLRAAHWLPVAGGNCVVERRGGEQPEASHHRIQSCRSPRKQWPHGRRRLRPHYPPASSRLRKVELLKRYYRRIPRWRHAPGALHSPALPAGARLRSDQRKLRLHGTDCEGYDPLVMSGILHSE